VVTEPTSDDRVVHNRLVRLVLEVRVPTGAELLARPAVHHVELLLGRPDLNTSLDTVGGQWTSTVDVPLLEDLLLDLGVAAYKVVERLDVRLCAVGGERQAVVLLASIRLNVEFVCVGYLLVVLEVKTNTGKIDEGLDTGLAKLLWVTDTRALENERRTQSTTRDDDLLAGLDDS
jgi:hypothetical protein